ncbi:hypothetical protein JW998_05615 [candidate division KSB1 bacterium]|nr:hypothetical protein [candidate division KSB1 bacterium]
MMSIENSRDRDPFRTIVRCTSDGQRCDGVVTGSGQCILPAVGPNEHELVEK